MEGCQVKQALRTTGIECMYCEEVLSACYLPSTAGLGSKTGMFTPAALSHWGMCLHFSGLRCAPNADIVALNVHCDVNQATSCQQVINVHVAENADCHLVIMLLTCGANHPRSHAFATETRLCNDASAEDG